MAGLMDIAPLTETIEVRGVSLQLSGLPPAAIATLWGRFPEIEKAIAKSQALDAKSLMVVLPAAIAPLIAAGMGKAGDAETEQAIEERLALDDKARALEVILRLTMPRGLGPFVQTLAGLMGSVGGASGTAPGSSSRKPSRN